MSNPGRARVGAEDEGGQESILGLYCGYIGIILGLYWGYIGVIYRDNGKENGNYYMLSNLRPKNLVVSGLRVNGFEA